MFAKINHVAIVSEKVRAHHQVLRGRVRDVPVEDLAEVRAHGRRRLCRPQHQPAQGGTSGRPRPFRHPGRGRRDRVRPHAHEISRGRLGAAAVDAAVRRHHRQRSRRQRVRHLAEGHEEPPRRLCAEHRRAAAALHHPRRDANHAAGRDGALLCRRVPVRRAERRCRRSQPLSLGRQGHAGDHAVAHQELSRPVASCRPGWTTSASRSRTCRRSRTTSRS